jgi:hypothetical protein
MMSKQLISLTFPIPYKSAGNIIRQKEVSFDIYKEGDAYKAVPLLNMDERRLANLPHELVFTHSGGKAISERGIKDGNFHIIEEIAKQLQSQNL